MNALLEKLHPRNWRAKHFAYTAALLLAVNLFGPKGFVHWVLISQESARLESKRVELETEAQRLRAEIKHFQKSDGAKARAIREELGYLKPEEVSIEFIRASNDEQRISRNRGSAR